MTGPSPLTGFEPVVDEGCRVLVLGSFPGVASLRAGHYYAHPTNLFWSVMSALLKEDLREQPFEVRYARLRQEGLGLWDVIARCEREGSLDASIRQARPAGLAGLVPGLPRLSHVLLNGRTAERHAKAFDWPATVALHALPSTSAAYAVMPANEKLARWLDVLHEALGQPVV